MHKRMRRLAGCVLTALLVIGTFNCISYKAFAAGKNVTKTATFYYLNKGESINNEQNGGSSTGNESAKYTSLLKVKDAYSSFEELLATADAMITNGTMSKDKLQTFINSNSKGNGSATAPFEYDGTYLSIAEEIGTNFSAYAGSETILDYKIENMFDPADLSRLFAYTLEYDENGVPTGNIKYVTGNTIDWYVLKDTSGGGKSAWHVDGVLLINGEKEFILSVNKPIVSPEPEEPEEPETPEVTEPEEPEEPKTPEVTEPEEPEEPETPEVTEPEEPEEPKTPEVTEPEEPEEPKTPEVTEPEEPEEPKTPEVTEPEEPETPEITEPEVPEEPKEPETPVVPDTPNTPEGPSEPGPSEESVPEITPVIAEEPVVEELTIIEEATPLADEGDEVIIEDEETPLAPPSIDATARAAVFTVILAFGAYISGSTILSAAKLLIKK